MVDARLVVDGLVGRTLQLSLADLQCVAPEDQVCDVRQLGAKRPGRAVRIADLLDLTDPSPEATHLGLHSSLDNFHASIPLEPVRDRGLVIYAVDDESLSVDQGGPFRFFIPDHAACHRDEIDECANVKHLDRIELTRGKGFDNRPEDDDEHARLHQK